MYFMYTLCTHKRDVNSGLGASKNKSHQNLTMDMEGSHVLKNKYLVNPPLRVRIIFLTVNNEAGSFLRGLQAGRSHGTYIRW